MTVAVCAGCGRTGVNLRGRSLDGGHLCSNCVCLANSGTCTTCGEFRRFDGHDSDGQRWCQRCRARHNRPDVDRADRATIIEIVASFESTLDRSVISDALMITAASQRSLSRIRQHLSAHPDTFSVGPTSINGAVHRFTLALIAAGSTMITVIHPICVGCGQSRRAHSTTSRGKECATCWSRSNRAPCSRCGLDRRIAHRDADGRPRCTPCWEKEKRQAILTPIDTAITTRALANNVGLSAADIVTAIQIVAAHVPERILLRDALDNGPPLDIARCREPLVARFLQQLRCFGSALPAAICPACRRPAEPLITHRTEVRCRECAQTCCSCARPNDPDRIICKRCTVNPRSRGDCTDCHRRGVPLDESHRCRACREHVERICAICRTNNKLTDLNGRQCCYHCVLAHEFDTMTGPNPPAWQIAMRQALLATSNAETTRHWLHRSAGGRLFTRITQDETLLSHDTLDRHPSSSISHLRSLLITAGALPPDDRWLDRLEQQLHDIVATINHPDDRRTLDSWVRWNALPPLRRRSEQGASTEHSGANLRRKTRVIVDFANTLNSQERGLATCTQTDLDTWFAQPSMSAQIARSFLVWATENRHLPDIQIPPARRGPPSSIDAEQRWRHARRLVNDTTIAADDRVLGALVVLYAQPLTRITALTTNDVHHDGQTVTVTLAGTTIELPEPFAALALQLPLRRRQGLGDNLPTRWLFPSTRPDRAINPETLGTRLRRLGISPRSTRLAALAQLAAEIPPGILALTIGTTTNTAARWAATTGGNWTAYAKTKPPAK